MAKKCAIANCSSLPNLNYFSFPKDKSLASIWMQKCDVQESDASTSTVCERHFDQNCFDSGTKTVKRPRKIVLKPDAVPTLLLTARCEPLTDKEALVPQRKSSQVPVPKIPNSEEIDGSNKKRRRQSESPQGVNVEDSVPLQLESPEPIDGDDHSTSKDCQVDFGDGMFEKVAVSRIFTHLYFLQSSTSLWRKKC